MAETTYQIDTDSFDHVELSVVLECYKGWAMKAVLIVVFLREGKVDKGGKEVGGF